MSDPFIRSQSARQNLGSQRMPSKQQASSQSADALSAKAAEAYLRSSGPSGTRERLNSFLSKLESTWLLFNRGTTESSEGELPDGRLALLADDETPSPETLKELRARFKQQTKKAPKSGDYLFRSSAKPENKPGSGGKKKSAAQNANQGPKPSPLADRSSPKGLRSKTTSPSPPKQQQTLKSGKSSQKPPAPKPSSTSPLPTPRPQTQSPHKAPRRPYQGPTVSPQASPKSSKSTGEQKSVLGRKPGSSPKPQKSAQSQGRSLPAKPDIPKSKPSGRSLGQRRPSLAAQRPRPNTSPSRGGTSSFLGTSSQSGLHFRSSDASGRPGRVTIGKLTGRQAVLSQSVAKVSSQFNKRSVSSQMPICNAFLDECYEGPGQEHALRLDWRKTSKGAKSANQRLFSNRRRLQLGKKAGGGKSLGRALNLGLGQTALSSARTDVSGRIAGAAIGSLLDDLYEEEEVENLDEETAVTSLGLILRLGGEFTYKHSTRVLDLALELADEVGVRDKKTRREIKFGAMLRDIGEFDLLLQGDDAKTQQRLSEFSGFLQGQDLLRAGLLHDIGKVKIPPEILYKPGKLTPEEYEVMKMHPIYGEEIVARISSLRYLCPTIRGHHERWDGKGYPDGLSKEDIPLAARIISVADVFDALAAERPYKRGMEVQKVNEILEEGRGSHFDPFLVDAFLDVINRRYPH